MDFAKALSVSSSGLSAQRQRMNSISSNIANINTTRTIDGGGPYKRKDVVFEAIPEANSFGEILTKTEDRNMQRVQVVEVSTEHSKPIAKYEPNHVDADEKGYVYYPNINLMEEMANMIQATRSYEANVSAMQATKDMALSALELGR